MKKKLFTLLTLLLCLCSGAWGDNTLFNVDFTQVAQEEIKTSVSGATFVAKTYQGYNMSFGVKSGKSINILANNGGLEFSGNNYESYNCLAIPLTLTASQKVTVTVVVGSGTVKYGWKEGVLPSTPSPGSGTSATISGTTCTIEYTPTKAGQYVLYLGRSGSGAGKVVKSIVITQSTSTPTCTTPTITVDNTFNFEHKGYKVTITNTEGETLKVSTDGETYTTQTSPYVTYATTTTHYYAKSVKDSYDDSDVADKNVTNTFDGGKKYIAWVYTDDYTSKDDVNAKYHFNNDPMVDALSPLYNVVAVNYAGDTTPSNDLNNADLIVLTEAVSGSAAMTKAMKGFVGNVPMINMKFFAYTNEDARWQWGTPANPGTATTKITPNSKLYKVLNGVAFDGDDISLYSQISSTSKANGVQTVTWMSEPVDFVSSNTDMAVTNSKVSMHAGTKFFGIGLSCDSRSYYNENAFTIIKNAAAMLIAGEDLSTEVATVSGTITASGWNTFSSSYALDLSTISGGTAYVATRTSDKSVTMSECKDIVEAGTGLMIKGTDGATFTINTTSSAATFNGENLLKGLPNGGTVTANDNNYVFAWPTDKPEDYGFYFVNDFEPSLPAGKAYLHVDGGSNARLNIVFEGETTGISNLNVNNNDNIDANAPMYNLAGQKVSQNYKGIVIVNGKKVVRK